MITWQFVASFFLIVLGGVMVSSKSVDIFGKVMGIVVILIGAISFIAQM